MAKPRFRFLVFLVFQGKEKKKMKKTPNRYRAETILVKVTQEEKNQIRKNMQVANIGTMTNYMRKMALSGRVITIDFSTLRDSLSETGKYVYELNKIGNNLNQIAHKLNQTNLVEKEDVLFLLQEFQKMKENYTSAERILLKETQKIARKK